MKVQGISNNQNFEGKIVSVGRISKYSLKPFLEAKQLLQDRVTFAPFDVFIRESKLGIEMSYSKKFSDGFFVRPTNYTKRKTLVAGDFVSTYNKMQTEIAERIKKENFFERLKYFLGIKKFIG